MAVTEQDVQQAEARMATLRESGFAVSARYDRRSARIVINLSTGVQIAFPPRLAEGPAGSPVDLAEIEISLAGLGLHWPRGSTRICTFRRCCKGLGSRLDGGAARSRAGFDRVPRRRQHARMVVRAEGRARSSATKRRRQQYPRARSTRPAPGGLRGRRGCWR